MAAITSVASGRLRRLALAVPLAIAATTVPAAAASGQDYSQQEQSILITGSDVPSGFSPVSSSEGGPIDIPAACDNGNTYLANINSYPESSFTDNGDPVENQLGSSAIVTDSVSDAQTLFSILSNPQTYNCTIQSDANAPSGVTNSGASVTLGPNPSIGDQSADIVASFGQTDSSGNTAATSNSLVTIRVGQVVAEVGFESNQQGTTNPPGLWPSEPGLQSQLAALVASRMEAVEAALVPTTTTTTGTAVPSTTTTPATQPSGTSNCTPAVSVSQRVLGIPTWDLPLYNLHLPADLGAVAKATASFADGDVNICTGALVATVKAVDPTVSLLATDSHGKGLGEYGYDVGRLAWLNAQEQLIPSIPQSHFDLVNGSFNFPHLDLSNGNVSLQVASVKLRVLSPSATLVNQNGELLEAEIGPSIGLEVDVTAQSAINEAANGKAGGESDATAEADSAEIEAENGAAGLADEIRAFDTTADTTHIVEVVIQGEDQTFVAALSVDQAAIDAAANAELASELPTDAGAIGGDAGAAAVDGDLGDGIIEVFGGVLEAAAL